MERLSMPLVSSQLWVPDGGHSKCQICAETFSAVIRRRHHCRVCGNLVCRECVTSGAAGFPELSVCLLCEAAHADPVAQVTLLEPPAPEDADSADAAAYAQENDPDPANDLFSPLRRLLVRLGMEEDGAGGSSSSGSSSRLRTYCRPLSACAWYFGTMSATRAAALLRAQPPQRGAFLVHRQPTPRRDDAFRLVARTPVGIVSLPVAVSALEQHGDGGVAPHAIPGAPWCCLNAGGGVLAVRRPSLQDLVVFYMQHPCAGLWLGPPAMRTEATCPDFAHLQFGSRWRRGVLNGHVESVLVSSGEAPTEAQPAIVDDACTATAAPLSTPTTAGTASTAPRSATTLSDASLSVAVEDLNVDDDVDPDDPRADAEGTGEDGEHNGNGDGASTSLFASGRYRRLLGLKLPSLLPYVVLDLDVKDNENNPNSETKMESNSGTATETESESALEEPRLAAAALLQGGGACDALELLYAPSLEAGAETLVALRPGAELCPQCRAAQVAVGFFCPYCGLPLRKPPPDANARVAAAHYLAQGVPRTAAAVAALQAWRVEMRDVSLSRQVLGQGVYGKVQMALWREKPDDVEQQTVAAKRAFSGDDPLARAALLSEAAIMTVLAEKEGEADEATRGQANVIRLHGIVMDAGPTTILLEYVEEGNVLRYISTALKRETTEPTEITKQILRFATDIARGIAFLHHRRVLHRDLAARNCLLDAALTCKIGDFGKARRLPHGRPSLPVADDDSLAVNWLAPEVLQRRAFFCASEVWSYAVVVWEMFNRGGTPYGRLFAPEDLLPRLEDGLRLPRPDDCICFALLERCWSQRQSDRPTLFRIQADLDALSASLQ